MPTDYSNENNWAHLGEDTDYPVDTFFVYSTVYSNPEEGAPALSPINDPTMRQSVQANYEMAPAVFDDLTNVYEPYYRQSNLAVIADMSAEEFLEYQYQEQKTDIYAALDYYFEHYNNGKPFILAGHSQGSVMLKIALTDYFKEHEEYLDRMVAAYILGFSITKEDLEENPALKFAERADDTGVIISWNTEGPENANEDNFVVLDNAIAINPINWKLDDTKAEASENLGSRLYVPNEDGTLTCQESHPGLLDAQLDVDRGVVVCTTMPDKYVVLTTIDAAPFGPVSLHQMDYLGYWDNIHENVKLRIDAYQKLNQ